MMVNQKTNQVLKKSKKIVLQTIGLVFAIFCFIDIQNIFKDNTQYSYQKFEGSYGYYNQAFQSLEGFYKERKDSLDAVYIGASTVHAFWQPPLAWGDKGIAVYSYSIDGLKPQAYPFLIDEARKTQPNALLIFDINSFRTTEILYPQVHRYTNHMHFSINKLKAIYTLSDEAGLFGWEKLEFFFPIMRFHTRWKQLKFYDFNKKLNEYKNGLAYDPFFMNAIDVTSTYLITESETDINQKQKKILSNLLDYLDELKIKALFIASPQSLGVDNEFYGQINYIGKIVQDRGHRFLNLINLIDIVNIRTNEDFYNGGHINVHGAIKFTDYLGNYLIDNYGFKDKRGLSGWESWNASADLYNDLISPYTLPLEREHDVRDYDLTASALNIVVAENKSLILSWIKSENADGYDIYRKANFQEQKNWTYIASVDNNTFQFMDSCLISGVKYTYTVVPKKIIDKQTIYGNFDFTGISAVAQ